jgi:hypothetical protein
MLPGFFTDAQRAAADTAMNHVDKAYGGAAAYLALHGFADSDRTQLMHYLEPL